MLTLFFFFHHFYKFDLDSCTGRSWWDLKLILRIYLHVKLFFGKSVVNCVLSKYGLIIGKMDIQYLQFGFKYFELWILLIIEMELWKNITEIPANCFSVISPRAKTIFGIFCFQKRHFFFLYRGNWKSTNNCPPPLFFRKMSGREGTVSWNSSDMCTHD